MKKLAKYFPTILVILGVTGDLAKKKIIPSLYHLWQKERLPDMFAVVGFSRKNLEDKDFQSYSAGIVREYIGKEAAKNDVEAFTKHLRYQQGVFENTEDYEKLASKLKEIDDAWGVCSNKLFYLAVPPKFYETIFTNLAKTRLAEFCGPYEGWTRVIVEKPFGKDYATAEKLDEQLGSLFKEEQIYRIDHYLGKEMIQNILSFRFSNNLFEHVWDRESVEKIDIRLLEEIGVEDRGTFYDGVGALRDVGQNHLLQMLALVTMEHPKVLSAADIRASRLQILKDLVPMDGENIESHTFRAQYKGYREIKGVEKESTTETYFKARVFLKTKRWQGVPIVLESGKQMAKTKKEIVVTFRHPTPCLCPPERKRHYRNRIIFRLEPKEGIEIVFWSKKPGFDFEMEERTLDFFYRKKELEAPQGYINISTEYTDIPSTEYEKLLLDCIAGEQTLFVSTEEVKAMWQFIDPIAKQWAKGKPSLHIYKKRDRRIEEESRIVEKSNH